MSPKPARQRPGSTSALSRPTLTPNVEPLRVGDGPTESQTDRATDPGTPAVTESQGPAVPEQQTTRAPESGSPGVRQSQTDRVTDSRTPAVTEPGSPEGTPRYLTLVRKEARVRGDQADALAQLRRRISRARSDRTEPLTDNTLIRVAIDLLLEHSGELAGDTEDELRRSVLPLD